MKNNTDKARTNNFGRTAHLVLNLGFLYTYLCHAFSLIKWDESQQEVKIG